MRNYHEEALQFINNCNDLSLEVLDSQLERFAYLLKDSATSNIDQIENIKKTIELFKETAKSKAAKKGVELSSENEIDTKSINTTVCQLDSSSLGLDSDMAPAKLSKIDKAKVLHNLLQNPLINKGISCLS